MARRDEVGDFFFLLCLDRILYLYIIVFSLKKNSIKSKAKESNHLPTAYWLGLLGSPLFKDKAKSRLDAAVDVQKLFKPRQN